METNLQDSAGFGKISLRDVLDALNFLGNLGLVCDRCGWRHACLISQFQRRCYTCKAIHANYDQSKPLNDLQSRLFSSVGQWVTHVEAQGDGQGPGDPPVNPSQA